MDYVIALTINSDKTMLWLKEFSPFNGDPLFIVDRRQAAVYDDVIARDVFDYTVKCATKNELIEDDDTFWLQCDGATGTIVHHTTLKLSGYRK